MKRRFIERVGAVLGAGLIMLGSSAYGQARAASTVPVSGLSKVAAYPTKPVRLVAGNPGATADILARHVGRWLTERWGQQVIVDNRGGAGGIRFAEFAARATPDGYTLVMGNLPSHGIAVSIHRKLPYDPVKDFMPVARVALVPMLLVVHPSVPAGSLREFIDYARQRPGAIDYASAGNGTGSHLTSELFKQLTRLDLVQVQYKGGGAQMVAIMSGETKTGFAALSTAWPMLTSGKLKPLAIASKQRAEAVPNVPTFDEAGMPGFESTIWFGIFAPARTPAALVARLNRDIVEIARASSFRQELLKQGAEAAPTTPEDFGAFVKTEIIKWRGVMKLAGISPR